MRGRLGQHRQGGAVMNKLPDSIDLLCQIRDELKVIWLALGNTMDLADDGLLTPVREHVNGLSGRLHNVIEDMSDEALKACTPTKSAGGRS